MLAIFAMRDIVTFIFIKYGATVGELYDLTTDFVFPTSTPHESDNTCQVFSW